MKDDIFKKQLPPPTVYNSTPVWDPVLDAVRAKESISVRSVLDLESLLRRVPANLTYVGRDSIC